MVKREVSQAGGLLLFLDYDGTLAPLADHPSQVHLPMKTKRILELLASQPGIRVALISGRRLTDLKKKVDLPGLCYIGNHGLELQGDRLRHVNPAARACRPILGEIARRLRRALQPIRGAWVENKGLTLTVHYRSASAADAVLVKNGFYEALQPFLVKRQVRVTTGKRIFEVRPPVRWNKGTMVHWLMARHRVTSNAKEILPIYIGDDETDEEAFEALLGHGITVVVGSYTLLSRARYRLESLAEVQRLLQRLLAIWKRKEGKEDEKTSRKNLGAGRRGMAARRRAAVEQGLCGSPVGG
ncbi:MAG: trehalose-phosphatase [Candidatus Omnitrophica bacterium]|nr:trehalose-phosphatase [Candidatus Omnitrophota bacterium]